MIKLIVSDVDGTSIPEGGKDPDPHLFDYIRKLKNMGIRFAAASGRQYESVLHVFRPVKDDMVFIADNGSFIMEHDRVLASSIFDGDIWKDIVRYAQTIPGACLMVSSLEGTYTPSTDARFLSLMGSGYGVKMHYSRDLTALDLHVSKVAFYAPEQDPFALAGEGRTIFGEDACVLASGTHWVDFIAPQTNKGTALRILQNLLEHHHAHA